MANLNKFKIQITIPYQPTDSEGYDPLYANNQVVEKLKEVEFYHGRLAKTAFVMDAVMAKITAGTNKIFSDEAALHQGDDRQAQKWGSSLDRSMKVM